MGLQCPGAGHGVWTNPHSSPALPAPQPLPPPRGIVSISHLPSPQAHQALRCKWRWGGRVCSQALKGKV